MPFPKNDYRVIQGSRLSIYSIRNKIPGNLLIFRRFVVPENSNIPFSSVFLDKNPPIDAHIDEMLQWCKKIYGVSSNPGMKGNLSFRTGMGFIITGSGLMLNSVTKDTVVEVRGVVFGLNRPSIYTKGQAAPSEEALLHSVIYETFPEINAIFFLTSHNIIEAAEKAGVPSADINRPAGSQELAQEVENLFNSNNNTRSLIIKNRGVITLGKTMSEAAQLTEEIQKKPESGVRAKSGKK
jgi:ribulose-5-phosphate 4-epimerase/fuculose-1-phosphate aldolase